MKLGMGVNEYGTPVSRHVCDTCGGLFTVCPAAKDDSTSWINCLGESCGSYDPDRDIDIFFEALADNGLIERRSIGSAE